MTQVTHIKCENNNKYKVFDRILHKPIIKEAIIEIISTLCKSINNEM